MDLITAGKAALTVVTNPKSVIRIIFIVIMIPIVIILIFFVLILSIIPSISNENIVDDSSTISTIKFSKGLGKLSEKYESNGNPGIIADNDGDIGGKSYGAWQIASNVGTMGSFLSWLSINESLMYTDLYYAKQQDGGYGKNFDRTWKRLASKDANYFYYIQWRFIKHTHYDPVIKYFKKKKIDFDKRSWSLRNAIWSTAVQHGPGSGSSNRGAIYIIKIQDLTFSDNLKDDGKVITGIYNERMKVNKHFTSSSADIKASVYNRFIQEKADASEMLRQELLKEGE